MAESDKVRDAVADVDLKNLGEQPAFYAGLAFKGAVAHSNAMDLIRESATAAALRKITEVDVAEAISIIKATTGSDSASLLANLLAAGAFGQQAVKAATTTPRETGAGQPGGP